MDKELIIISGAGKGIGKFIAINIANEKNYILCISKSNNCQETAKGIIEKGFDADFLCLDIADSARTTEAVRNWLKQKRKFAKIDIVLAAGYLGKPCINEEEFDLNDWQLSYQINLLGNLAILNAAMPFMKELNDSKVVFFSGGGSAYGYPLFPSYSASKTAIVRTVENLSMIYKNYNFIFVAMAPGANKTDMLKEVIKYGGEVKTTVEIEEPFSVVKNILTNTIDAKLLNGRFIHVRDSFDNINNDNNLWKLRRIEESK